MSSAVETDAAVRPATALERCVSPALPVKYGGSIGFAYTRAAFVLHMALRAICISIRAFNRMNLHYRKSPPNAKRKAAAVPAHGSRQEYRQKSRESTTGNERDAEASHKKPHQSVNAPRNAPSTAARIHTRGASRSTRTTRTDQRDSFMLF